MPLFVFLVALTLRIVHLVAVAHSPFAAVLLGDAAAYDAWAQRIADGDVLGRDVFYQAPLYPYFLSLIYAVAGPDLFIARLVQSLVGAAGCALLAVAGSRFFDRRAGFVAGMLLAVYPPAVFFDLTLQKTVLDALFIAALLVLAAPPVSREVRGRWFALGAVLASFCLTRENALALIPVFLAWALWGPVRAASARADRAKSRRTAALALLLGLGVVLGPVALRNRLVGGEFALTTAQFGPNFYMGNHAGATGLYTGLRPGRQHPDFERADAVEIASAAAGRALSPAEVSAWWRDQAFSYIREQPVDWLRLLARKWMLVWNAVEVADSEDVATYAEFSAVLRVPLRVLHFGVLAPIAALGLCLTWRRRGRLWLLYALLLAFAASVAAFYVFARYRFPLVPILLLFCGAACSAIMRRRTQPRTAAAARKSATPDSQGIPNDDRRPGRVAWMTGAAVAAAVAIAANWPMLPGFDPTAATWNNLGLALVDRGNAAAAVRCFDHILARYPELPEANNNLATALLALGETDRAARHAAEALRHRPDLAGAHVNLSAALRARNRLDEAEQHAREAVRLTPGSPRAQAELAAVLAARAASSPPK